MRTIRTSLGDVELVSVTVTDLNGQNITADSFKMSFGTATEPGAWFAPDSVTDIDASDVTVSALVGNGHQMPTPGRYHVWVQVTGDQEVISFPNDRVRIE